MQNKPMVIAWHLPQFHQIPENDKWWGEGFTEWTNIKKAKPLFKGHYQPRVPLNNNYYNMLDKETMQWQHQISTAYGVDAFCYYHYWFDGKMLLEKPMENLLEWKDIPQKFCISWANEPWSRTWSGTHDKEVLMPQKYSGEEGWKKHFDYLIKFFLDERYIKVDNCPVFLLYRANSIPDCDAMIECWDKWAKENGLNGMHIIETINAFQTESVCCNSKATVKMRPMKQTKRGSFFTRAIRKMKRILNRCYGKVPVEQLYSMIIKEYNNAVALGYSKPSYDSGFISWDNAPRRANNALIYIKESPKLFENFMTQMFQIAKKDNAPFLFFNAWNEWCEGTYLEPDEKYGYAYLEALKRAKESVL